MKELQVKLKLVYFILQESSNHRYRTQCTLLTPQTGTPLRTHPTLLWVSSQVSHHLLVMGSGVVLHPMQARHTTAENSPSFGVSILSSKPSLWATSKPHHCDGIRGHSTSHTGPAPSPVLPHRSGPNFTPWWGEYCK